MGNHLLKDWPPYSPDLNIIEVIWAIMKRRLDAIPSATLDQMKVVIMQVWNELEFSTINKLVDSIYNRMALVIAKGGERVFSNELG